MAGAHHILQWGGNTKHLTHIRRSLPPPDPSLLSALLCHEPLPRVAAPWHRHGKPVDLTNGSPGRSRVSPNMVYNAYNSGVCARDPHPHPLRSQGRAAGVQGEAGRGWYRYKDKEICDGNRPPDAAADAAAGRPWTSAARRCLGVAHEPLHAYRRWAS